MAQERFGNLKILSIERENCKMNNYDDVIEEFATVKSRKMYLHEIFS